MKKTITFAILALLAVQVLAQEVKFTADKADWHSVSWSDKWNVLRFEIPIETPIPHAEVTGKAMLIAVPDTVQYLKAYTFDVQDIYDMLTRFSLKDGKLIISDPNHSLYILHYTGETIGLIANSRSRVCKETDIEAVNVIDSAFSIFVEASSKTGSSLLMKSMLRMMKMMMSGKDLQSISYGFKAGLDATNSVVPQPSSEVIEDNQTFRPSDYQISEDLNISPSENLSKKEAYGNPFQLDFLWGFSNWGGSPFTGLMGMSDAGYSLRTSFSSYQLEGYYNLILTRHFNFGLGLGYESDIYKFSNDFVDYRADAFTAIDTLAAGGYYSTRFVTRYVQLPVHIGWRVKESSHEGFRIELAAIPALGWCGKHTGLKHEFHQDGTNLQDQRNLTDAVNPFKLDVRLKLKFSGIGVFLQVATMPLFLDGTKIYPIKLGFFL
ncbi:MAG: hypothetical protein MJZ45_05805 [Bacteroidales bacterium]|nr:hypothetical protein [Bacteroidales bacterium]